ncbi:MAG: (d)CMP kinase [Gemmatimonadota bacterium]
MSGERVVAIDGPSASGKSSTAGLVAQRLGLIHVDTGALYRALAWVALEEGSEDPDQVLPGATRAGLSLDPVGGALVVRANGRDIEAALRTPEVSAGASRVASHPELREWVNLRLREGVAAAGGGVLDGRDIGTVVFPDARLKVFLTASPEARAGRRLQQRDGAIDPELLAGEATALAERDARDAERAVAPLRQAADAILIDTTSLSLAAQVDRIVALALERGLPGQ